MEKLTWEEQVALKKLRTGKYLKELRENQGISLRQLGKALDVSANFLSSIERGEKSPSDALIMKLADHFNISDTELFDRYGKVPLVTREELSKSKHMKKLLNDIAKDDRLNDDEKEQIYEDIYKHFRTLVDQYHSK